MRVLRESSLLIHLLGQLQPHCRWVMPRKGIKLTLYPYLRSMCMCLSTTEEGVAPCPAWAVVTSLRSYPPSHCRFPVWSRESNFELVVSPLLWPEVLLILFLLVKSTVHEHWVWQASACQSSVCHRTMGMVVSVPVWVLHQQMVTIPVLPSVT